jgi:Putative viral replication protein.
MPTYNPDLIKFLVFSKEQCPTTNKLHWQGYVEFERPVTGVRAFAVMEVHSGRFFHSNGTAKENVEYCSKSSSHIEGPFLFGHEGIQGHRSDLDDMMDDIESGLTGKQMLQKWKGTGLRYINMIQRARRIMNDLDDDEYRIEQKKAMTNWIRPDIPGPPFDHMGDGLEAAFEKCEIPKLKEGFFRGTPMTSWKPVG